MYSKLHVCLFSAVACCAAILSLPASVSAQDSAGEEWKRLGKAAFFGGRLEEAESYLRKSIAYFEAKPEESATAAVVRADLAWLMLATGNFREAERLMKSALKVLEKNKTENCKHTAVIVSQLGILHRKMHEYGRAERFMKAGLKQAERCMPSYVEVALNNLAILYAETKRMKEAKTTLEKALTLIEHQPRTDETALELAQTLTSLAAVEQVSGRFSAAELLLLRAISVLDHSAGESYSVLTRSFQAIAWEAMALLHYQQRKLDDAERELRYAIETNNTGIIANRSRVTKMAFELAEVLTAKGRYDEAKGFYEQALHNATKETAETATVLERFSKLLRTMNADSRAAEMEYRAKRIRAALAYTVPVK